MKKSNNALFAQHLEKIELLAFASKRLTESIPHIESAEKTLTRVWDILADSLPSSGPVDMDELSTLSSIIQRTASASKSIKSLEIDSVDLTKKTVDFESMKQTLLSDLNKLSGELKAEGFTTQTLQKIEDQLNLL